MNIQKAYRLSCVTALLSISSLVAFGQSADEAAARLAKSNAELEARATEWVSGLNLNDAQKADRLEEVIATHLKAVRDWNNAHPATEVPAGINPTTGQKLSDLERQIIVNSAKPESVHENLMAGLRKDLSEEQVAQILDEYTIGKVDFTMKGYRAIVPDLTDKEAADIRALLEQAREQAIDFKSMKQISGIFEIYKSKAEQYLNNNGRSWRQLFKAYVDKRNAEKAAQK